MCEFLSWIEYKEEIIYITAADLETSKGKKLLKDVGWEDIKGHGAIRKFFTIPDGKGTNKECTDFSTPTNFPKEIVRDIKKGLFIGFGTPSGILIDPIDKAYRTQKNTLYKAYRAQKDTLYKAYEAQIDPIDKAYRTQKNTIDKAYRALIDTYWNLVKIKKNRVKAWQ